MSELKRTRSETLSIIIELALFLLLLILIDANLIKYTNKIIIILSIFALILSIYLTIINRKKIYKPHLLIFNNLYILIIFGNLYNKISGYPNIVNFQLLGILLGTILCMINYKVYEKVYLRKK